MLHSKQGLHSHTQKGVILQTATLKRKQILKPFHFGCFKGKLKHDFGVQNSHFAFRCIWQILTSSLVHRQENREFSTIKSFFSVCLWNTQNGSTVLCVSIFAFFSTLVYAKLHTFLTMVIEFLLRIKHLRGFFKKTCNKLEHQQLNFLKNLLFGLFPASKK